MVAELISVGTELLLGNIVNTNAAYLSKKLAALGINVYYQTTVGDNEGRLAEALQAARERSDLVILTGGLGPTKDDLTKEVTAAAVGRMLVLDEAVKEDITSYFKQKGKNSGDIPQNNWKQAMIIEGATVLRNENGTAPGLIVTEEDTTLILLPGPPNELVPMTETQVIPYLSSLSNTVFYSAMVKLCGIGESQVEMEIADLIEKQTNPTIAP